jgi:type IV secretory pathway VirB6-like protein
MAAALPQAREGHVTMGHAASHNGSWLLRVAVVLLLCIGAMMAPQSAKAQVTGIVAAPGVSCPPSYGASGGLVANCDCYAGLSNRIVGCVRQTLDNTASAFLNPYTGFYSIVRKPIFALITLAIAIYGVMLASGMVEKPSRDTLVLLLKIAFVVWAVENTQWIYDYLMNMIDALSAAMFQFNTLDNLSGYACPNLPSVWIRIDCVIDKAIGINLETFRPSDLGTTLSSASQNVINQGLSKGLIGTYFTLMKGSDVGFMVGVIGIISTWTMIVFLIKVLFSFLAAFIGLVFMVTIAPLFLPLVIFKSTKQYFDKWVKVVISTALQPVLLITFVTFAVAAMDLVIFSGERSVYRTLAGNAALAPDFNMNQYLMGTPIDLQGITADDSRHLHPYQGGYLRPNSVGGLQVKGEDNLQDFNNIIGTAVSAVSFQLSECTDQSIGVVTPSVGKILQNTANAANGGTAGIADCSKTFDKRLPFYDIDYERLAQDRVPPVVPAETQQTQDPPTAEALGRALKREVMASVILAAAVMFLVNALMRVVPEIANDLTGEFQYTPNYFNVGGDWQSQKDLSNTVSQSAAQLPSTLVGRR